MKKKIKHDQGWAEAKRLCRLNQEDIRMAKELGMSPRSLMKNIPSKSQQWKAPVKYWIRDLYEKHQLKVAKRKAAKGEPWPAKTTTPSITSTSIVSRARPNKSEFERNRPVPSLDEERWDHLLDNIPDDDGDDPDYEIAF